MENNFFTMLWKAFLHCLQGIPLTLELTAASVIAGFVLAIPLAMIHAQRDTWGAKIVRAYTYFFTGTPLLMSTATTLPVDRPAMARRLVTIGAPVPRRVSTAGVFS